MSILPQYLQDRPLVLATAVVASIPILLVAAGPFIWYYVGKFLGFLLTKKTEGRRSVIVSVMNEENEKYWQEHAESKSNSSGEWEKVPAAKDAVTDKTMDKNKDWDGIVGFFHPFCNAGGGGERVLWAAIRATQLRWPKSKCVVYTGDHEVTKEQIIARVKSRFNIELHAPTVQFLYLSKRSWVLASSWPRFTLLGQSVGSLVLGLDAFSLLVPDVFIDTMGYAFTLGLAKFLFPKVPTGAYVHYPTISTDMLESLDPDSPLGSRGVNGGQGTGARGFAKMVYWHLFSYVYCWFGASIDVVMTNSTWTQAHIKHLWGPYRKDKDAKNPIAVVFPPVAVEELEEAIAVSEESERKIREDIIIYIAQFRPEKDHRLVVDAFAQFLKTKTPVTAKAKLVLVGSVRDDQDAKRVYELRLMCYELGIKDRVEFHLDASWPEILEWLGKASVGVNGMWNEHFGIGVVEYQAAGLISVVHDSGGPKLDIVVPVDGLPTGFHVSDVGDFAKGFEKALSIQDKVPVRLRARKSAQRFTEAEFAKKWIAQAERLVAMKNVYGLFPQSFSPTFYLKDLLNICRVGNAASQPRRSLKALRNCLHTALLASCIQQNFFFCSTNTFGMMCIAFRPWIVCAIFLVFISWAATVDAKANWEQWGEPEDYDEKLQKSGVTRERWEIYKRVFQGRKAAIKIETITTCELKHVDSTGCHAQDILYPSPPVRDARWDMWDPEKQYTITWSNVDDNYPQQFQWHNYVCGGLNKTLNTGQRSFTFTFKELAAEYPASQCNYTTAEFLGLANSTKKFHSLSVEQLLHPFSGYGYRAGVVLWTARSRAVAEAQLRRLENIDQLEL